MSLFYLPVELQHQAPQVSVQGGGFMDLQRWDPDFLKPGWIMTDQKQLISPRDYNSNVHAIGIVGNIDWDERSIIVVSLDRKYLPWIWESADGCGTTLIQEDGTKKMFCPMFNAVRPESLLADKNGKSIRKKIKTETEPYSSQEGIFRLTLIGTLPAVHYCAKYHTEGTSEGDWYLPAWGELYYILRNNLWAINLGLSTVGKDPISEEEIFWTSSEYSSAEAWRVDARELVGPTGEKLCAAMPKIFKYNVIPCLKIKFQKELHDDDLLEIAKETSIGGYYGEGYINNAMKMSSSFFKNWRSTEDIRYLNTYNKLEKTLKNIDFNSVYVDVGNYSGLITVCMSLKYGIQLDVIAHVDDADNNTVMYSIMMDGDLMVMNEIDLEDVPTMVEQIINSIQNKTMQ